MSNWHTVQVTAWRVKAESGGPDIDDLPWPEDEFDNACAALEEARKDHPTHEFYLVAEIDA